MANEVYPKILSQEEAAALKDVFRPTYLEVTLDDRTNLLTVNRVFGIRLIRSPGHQPLLRSKPYQLETFYSGGQTSIDSATGRYYFGQQYAINLDQSPFNPALITVMMRSSIPFMDVRHLISHIPIVDELAMQRSIAVPFLPTSDPRT